LRDAASAVISLRDDKSAITFGDEDKAFIRGAPDGGVRIVSRSGSVSLRPGPDASVRVEGSLAVQGNLALGSGGAVCDDASRGQMRFVRGHGSLDQVLVCASVRTVGAPPEWVMPAFLPAAV
jgi:hypothetical protein